MISGNDFVIPIPIGCRTNTALEICTLVLSKIWPRMTIKDAKNNKYYRKWNEMTFGEGDGEMFVYRDDNARVEWGRNGLTKDNAGAMVHLIAIDNELTVVMDHAGQNEMKLALDGIELRMKIKEMEAWRAEVKEAVLSVHHALCQGRENYPGRLKHDSHCLMYLFEDPLYGESGT